MLSLFKKFKKKVLKKHQPPFYQQLTNKYRSFQTTLKKQRLTTNCLTSSSFLLFSSSLLLVPIKSPRNLPFSKRESRQGTWTRGKGVCFTKVGEVGSAKCTMKNEALVKIQIFWVGLEIQLSQPDVSCCLFTVFFFDMIPPTKMGAHKGGFQSWAGNKNPYGPPRSLGCPSRDSRNLLQKSLQ